MGMKQQVLSPRVQNGGEADLGAKAFGISRQLQQCLRSRVKQQFVQQPPVAEHQRVQQIGNREHHMKVRNGQHPFESLLNPGGLFASLALRAMAVAAGIVGHHLKVATRALLDVPAERRGSALHQLREHRRLFW